MIKESLGVVIDRRRFLADAAKFAIYAGAAYELSNIIVPALDGDRAKAAEIRDIASQEPYYQDHGTHYLADKPYHIIGVTHTNQTLFNYRSNLDAAIRFSPFVISEYFSDEVRFYAKPSINLRTTSHDTLHTASVNFFAGVGQLAAMHQKDVLVVNPDTSNASKLDTLDMALSGGPLIGFTSEQLIQAIIYGKISRRRFLGALAIGAPAIAKCLSILKTTRALRTCLQQAGLMDQSLTSEQRADVLGYSYFDWRDLDTVRGIEKSGQIYASEFKPELTPPALIQGDFHSGVIEYMRNSSLRQLKSALYPHYSLLGDNTIRRYHFDDQINTWQLIDQQSY